MEILNENTEDQDIGIERILSVWPIISCFVSYASAGDLISLSRTSTTIRAITHGFPIYSDSSRPEIRNLVLSLGDHQTVHWANLKASSQFVCSSSAHSSTKKHPTRPCRFCSRPICQACIVRTFFANPHENTFKHRTRYLCPTCWDWGNLRKDFRYPVDQISREHLWRGRNYAQRGTYCSCSASSDNWLCITCKDLQNQSAVANQTFTEVSPQDVKKRKRPHERFTLEKVKCYGLDCHNEIFEADRERRRICLWCSKPLPRQFAGEDRLRWESKQVEIRAASAASRSADIAEWARNRFRNLTMSRREMRGHETCVLLTDGKDSPEHDQPLFVRHLDAVNYRASMGQSEAPTPDHVYKSKHGHWTYTREFLYKFNLRLRKYNHVVKSINGVSTTELFNMTHAGSGLPGARTNLTILKQIQGPYYHLKRYGTCDPLYMPFQQMWVVKTLVSFQAMFWEAQLLPFGQSALDIVDMPTNEEVLQAVVWQLLEQVQVWEGQDDATRHEWKPPSLKMIIEDAEASLKMKKAVEEVGRSSQDVNEDRDMVPATDETAQLNRQTENHAGNTGDQDRKEREDHSYFLDDEDDMLTESESDSDEEMEQEMLDAGATWTEETGARTD